MSDKKFTLSKTERLYLQNRIDSLFTHGQSFVSYPLRVIYIVRPKTESEPQTAILASVSKKKFKRAVKRNRIKRLIREAYRLNKLLFQDIGLSPDQSVDIAFIYLKNELCEYAEIEKSMFKTISILTNKFKLPIRINESNS